MLNDNINKMLLVLIVMSINLILCEDNIPLKKITIQDKIVYKMRHDFWPKKDQGKGILPFLEIISRKRRSSELDEINGSSENITDDDSTLPSDPNVSIENADINNDYFLKEIPSFESVTELDPNEVDETETTPNEDSADLLVFDLDVAENTLIFRPLFAYRYKKRREKLNREDNL